MIRPAVPADGPSIAAVQRRTWHATYRGILPDDVLDGFDVDAAGRRWTAAVASPRPDSAVFVAEREGGVVGFAAVAGVEDEAGVGEVEAVYVAPEHQERGLGRGLLDAAVGSLSALGFTEGILWVAAANHGARGFYERLGWGPDGGRRLWRGASVVRYRRPLSGEGETADAG
ncbi:MAG TPA: GNAT family N-acetyltransferase [Gaiellaceae bacterium]|nr:GNAT family N-acetyltransferase [Gaiellaceae bacterium]